MKLNYKKIPLLLLFISLLLLRFGIEPRFVAIFSLAISGWLFITLVSNEVKKRVLLGYGLGLVITYLIAFLLPNSMPQLISFFILFAFAYILSWLIIYLSTRSSVSDMQR